MNYFGSPYSCGTCNMLEVIFLTAKAAERSRNIKGVLELWTLQQAVLSELNYVPKDNLISLQDVHTAFVQIGNAETDLTKLMDL